MKTLPPTNGFTMLFTDLHCKTCGKEREHIIKQVKQMNFKKDDNSVAYMKIQGTCLACWERTERPQTKIMYIPFSDWRKIVDKNFQTKKRNDDAEEL